MAPSCLEWFTGMLSHRELVLWLLSTLEKEEFPISEKDDSKASEGDSVNDPRALSDTNTMGTLVLLSPNKLEK